MSRTRAPGSPARAALARAVARRSSSELERAPIGPLLLWALPVVLRAAFRRDYSVDLDGKDIDALVVVTVVRGGGRPGQVFEVAIERRRCRVRRHRRGDRRPDGTMTVPLADLVRMLAGATAPHLLAAEGRVVTSGDNFLLARFPAMFRQPTRPAI